MPLTWTAADARIVAVPPASTCAPLPGMAVSCFLFELQWLGKYLTRGDCSAILLTSCIELKAVLKQGMLQSLLHLDASSAAAHSS